VRPEMIVGMYFIETLADNEVIVVEGHARSAGTQDTPTHFGAALVPPTQCSNQQRRRPMLRLSLSSTQ